MAYGKVTTLDPVAIRKKSMTQKTSKDCTEEELIDSGNIYFYKYFFSIRKKVYKISVIIKFKINLIRSVCKCRQNL